MTNCGVTGGIGRGSSRGRSRVCCCCNHAELSSGIASGNHVKPCLGKLHLQRLGNESNTVRCNTREELEQTCYKFSIVCTMVKYLM